MSREALLVLGMHRSGTSAVAGLLVRLGAQPPKTLMEADADNREGYWESSALCAFHERLLQAAGSRGTRPDISTGVGVRRKPTSALGNECRSLLRAEYGDAHRLVVKDPRICRFVPFWLRILQMEDIVPRVVIVHRSPFEVACSLSVPKWSSIATSRSLSGYGTCWPPSSTRVQRVERSFVIGMFSTTGKRWCGRSNRTWEWDGQLVRPRSTRRSALRESRSTPS